MLTKEKLDKLRKDIVFTEELSGERLQFHSTWGIFSPREIDEGTRLLVDRLRIAPTDDCLDLGCGYGPIGLYMARRAPQGQTLMVDKDFMAVNYSNDNAERNRLTNAKAILSNAFDHIDSSLRFNVIASNIPAKVGKEMLSLILHDARQRLKPGGKLYVVTINGLRQYMKRNLNEIFGNYEKLKQGKSYTVALAVNK
ncbi:MAG: methyltransferase [Candidatus Thiodiazotropha sp. (ex Lucina aurantia)]|uniref:Ribosomal RNA large subunit methyltransferase G n=2 Tax=Candidatus Thiodiazotropha TaxID=1913444 RepID=A0A7Z1AEK4_9GAMM|nr:methyltransferase [Candidatus Thiodiazotropha endolucinida]MBT3011269.1 methyltransferase [Candidatus Thiodiazotropha sp. (ex Lucina pensylvanica)]MBT3015580.1 methyltransferase [Candidatus Thiodiazotropha taylori]MBT3040342.1 methyltransferase [Candidatus Thiodiazotropha sp. (ex Codakia orbicularis)]MBV2103185.1 methyltransferase [Candidatus Thiodiazotropha sp. (ex Lucina aurantia)]MBT3023408.1 methyltransferase [Candidatus Thiodiazotropha taylori]